MDKLDEYLKYLNFIFVENVEWYSEYKIVVNDRFFRLLFRKNNIYFIETVDFILPSIEKDLVIFENDATGINKCIKFLHKHELFCLKLRKLKINKLLNE